MIELRIKNTTDKSYANVRDALCRALVGNQAFINNDIIISDAYEKDNIVDICLGDETSDTIIIMDANISHVTEVLKTDEEEETPKEEEKGE